MGPETHLLSTASHSAGSGVVRPFDSIVVRSHIGKYHLLGSLGSGGMASVFLATTTGAGGIKKVVVVKKVREDHIGELHFMHMLLSEAHVAMRLSHPNVIHVYEVAEDAGEAFIVMEHVDGQSLRAISRELGRRQPFTIRHWVRMLCAVLDGLHYAHELRDYDGKALDLVHRDVSPHNVLVSYDGIVKVVDFGIAKALDSIGETRTGVLKGKIAYMAPEYARGQPIDRRADVFAAGIILWELLAGKRLWDGMTNTTILGKLVSDNGIVTPPSAMCPDVPHELDGICARALAWHPQHRFSTALDFKQALENWLSNSGPPIENREIGRLVADAFRSERMQVRKLIEAGMAAEHEADTVVQPGAQPPLTTPAAELRTSLAPASLDQPGSRRPRWRPALAIAAGIGAVAFSLSGAAHWQAETKAARPAAALAQPAVHDVVVALRTERPSPPDRQLEATPEPATTASGKAVKLPAGRPTSVRSSGSTKAREERPSSATTSTAESPMAKPTADDMMIPRVPKRGGPPLDTEMPWK